ncbi:metal-dependent hydrolase family protein [Amycolatopsis nigrescens]|uniref:metal-dependent hydrolase family protein n=1 Tax=Amycolatopsis nigrescens TaxID=381445 RepID=UPI000375F222|nr:amidohydrolase family protein [Amycolatopsis nigrescens]
MTRHGDRWGLRASALFDGCALHRGRPLVVVEGDRIADVDLSGADPSSDLPVADLGDATVLPGLVDSHAHLTFDPHGDVPSQMREESDDFLRALARRHARQALDAGITTVRDLGDRGYVCTEVRDSKDEELPEILVAGPPITRTGGHCWFLGGETDGVDGLVAAVRERARRGVDVVKIMATGGMLTPQWDSHESQYSREELAAVVRTAHAEGLPVTAHAHGLQGLADAAGAGVDGVEHCTFLTETGAVPDWATIEALCDAGTFIGVEEARLPGDDTLLPARIRRMLEARGEYLTQMSRAGARVVGCSDAGINPRKPHDVLPYGVISFAHFGFSTAEALASVTETAAHACGVGDRKGRVTAGYDADLLVVAGDLSRGLEGLLNVTSVVRAGREVRSGTGERLPIGTN